MNTYFTLSIADGEMPVTHEIEAVDMEDAVNYLLEHVFNLEYIDVEDIQFEWTITDHVASHKFECGEHYIFLKP